MHIRALSIEGRVPVNLIKRERGNRYIKNV
jgi:hypothetical protein